MNSRRSFIVQTTLAAGAFSFAKPLRHLALEPGLQGNAAKISILDISTLNNSGNFHSGYAHHLQTLNELAGAMQKEKIHSLVLATGNMVRAVAHKTQIETSKFTSASQAHLNNTAAFRNPPTDEVMFHNKLVAECNVESLHTYQIDTKSTNVLPFNLVQKGKVKIGIIRNPAFHTADAQAYEPGLKYLDALNATAWLLKDRYKCKLIVYMQNYVIRKNEDKINDIRLAAATKGIDLFVTPNNPYNKCRAYVAKNSDKQEVIISFSSAEDASPKRIEISFNHRMEKNGFELRPLPQA